MNASCDYLITRFNHAFGDNLMAGMFTAILNDNGVRASFYCNNADAAMYLDCPMVTQKVAPPSRRFNWAYESGLRLNVNFMAYSLERFAQQFGTPPLQMTRRSVPVRYQDWEEAPTVSVVMCTHVGRWSRYRNWPYFDKLKLLLHERGISYLDLHEQNIYGERALSCVARARLYLGLETGMSHFVSSVAKKGLILQSGYTNFEAWCSYDYEVQSVPVKCAPCYLRRGCKFRWKCMRHLSPESVLGAVLERV